MSAVPIVTYTSLYPNREMPRHGLFVERRLRELRATGRVEATVVAPVPWFPSGHRAFGEYGAFARVPREERRDDVEIAHPRYLMVPKLGMATQACAVAAATLPRVRRLQRAGRAHVIDAHYFYPDGVAAARVGRRLGIPVIVTARGSDVNVVARTPYIARMVRWAASSAACVVTVSEALRRELIELGVPAERVVTLRNGVDLDVFSPGDRAALRRELGLSRHTLLSVGRLVPGKGHATLIDALAGLPDCELVIAGDGPERANLEAKAAGLGVGDRLRLTGSLDVTTLVRYYRAADASVLASRAEGMPNVVLESLACGTPVIATAVGGVPEVLDESVGRLVPVGDAGAIVNAVGSLRAAAPAPTHVRSWAERFGWREPIERLAGLIEETARGGRRAA